MITEYLQLFDCRRTIHVARNEQHLTTLLALDVRGYFARKGRFTRALQTGNQHNRRRTLQFDVRCRTAHQRGQFVADDFGHHLPRFDRLQHVLSESLLLDLVGKRLGDLVIDIGIDERTTNLFERLRNIYLGNTPFAFENFERPFEFIG